MAEFGDRPVPVGGVPTVSKGSVGWDFYVGTSSPSYAIYVFEDLEAKNWGFTIPVLGITGGAFDSHEELPGPIYLQGDHGGIAYRNIILTPAAP